MKIYIIFFLCFILCEFHTQEPGANQDFGKYIKQIEYDTNFFEGGGYQLELVNPLRKLPKDKNWTLFEEGPENFKSLPNITVHKSRTFLGDTTSVSINGEYIEHQPNPYFSEVQPFSFYSDIVANKDWNVFRAYVRDSMARRILANWKNFDEWALYGIDANGYEMDESEWVIDWKSNKLDWALHAKNNQYPYLAELQYGESNDFYGLTSLDERKLQYHYYWKDYVGCANEEDSLRREQANGKKGHTLCSISWRSEIVSLYRDSTIWINDTSLYHFSNIEDGLCQFYGYHPYFQNYPVTGVNTPQARAYMKWMEINHQKSLDMSSLPIKVVYELPSSVNNENNSIEVCTPSFRVEYWKISNGDYVEFVNYTRDSIARRILADEHYPLRFSLPVLDASLEEKDYSEWILHWKPKLDWSRKSAKPFYGKRNKIVPEYGLLEDLYYPSYGGDTSLIDKRYLVIEQYYFDFKTAAIDFDKTPYRETLDMNKCGYKFLLNYRNTHSEYLRGRTLENLGKNLNLSHVNQNCRSTDIYCNQDRSQFIEKDIINVYPGTDYKRTCKNYHHNGKSLESMNTKDSSLYFDCFSYSKDLDWDSIPQEYDFKTNPNALIQNITYFQFLAYWRWRIQQGELPNNNENPAISHYIPSEDEFLKIQAGENVVHAEETHQLPTPTFRYVVKFYPKKD